jgi:hypothetical protein
MRSTIISDSPMPTPIVARALFALAALVAI